MADDIVFEPPPDYTDRSTSVAVTDIEAPETETGPSKPYPDAVIKVSDANLDKFKIWLDEWLSALIQSHNQKIDEWSLQEIAYRAKSEPPKLRPFVGACNDVIPVVAMAVDPIHARLDTGIFKNDPVFRLKALRRSWQKYTPALEKLIEYYQKHKLEMRRISSPQLLELTKHGTTIFKTVYDVEKYNIMTYDKEWNVIKKEITRFKGPRVFAISINDFLFPPNFQHLQSCPIVAERMRLSIGQLKIAEASGKLANVDKIKDEEKNERTDLELMRQISANHEENRLEKDHIEVFEVWCDYDINGDGIPERLVCTYHRETQTILQLRYNWYFHQRKPYTVIPYSVVNGSLYGLGICEMSDVFQRAQTKWHQMATDNAYLANIRMFIAKKESGIEEVPKLYTGRTFFVDNPQTDFVPFQAADVYQSTLSERQNLFGLAEKRTGVSDYLTGRESPIVGSRATATSTLALIQEGTRRVEEVMENVRNGKAEIILNCLYIWIQYGLDGIDDLVFDEDIANLLKEFFSQVNEMNVDGALAIDLAATDAANNRQIQQQVQLAIIQTMMQYLEKLIEAGRMALEAQMGGQPIMAELIGEVMKSARKMFKDLLDKYDVPNAEEYLPELERYLNEAAQQSGGPPAVGGPAGGPGIPPGFQTPPGVPAGAPSVGAALPGIAGLLGGAASF